MLLAEEAEKMLKRVVVFAYGVASYGVFFATFLYSVGFIGDLVVPKTMDSPPKCLSCTHWGLTCCCWGFSPYNTV